MAKSGNRRQAGRRLASAARTTGNALDLGPNEALDNGGQVFVEPAFQHRTKHFLHKVVQRTGVLREDGSGE